MNIINSNFDIDTQFAGNPSFYIDASLNDITITLPSDLYIPVFVFTRIDTSEYVVNIETKTGFTIRNDTTINVQKQSISQLQLFNTDWFITRILFN